MIISRTPLRMSFVGGGSDLPSYYREHGGAVVSTAIDKYVYVTMNRKFDSGIRVAYSRVEEVNSVSEIEHQLVRAALNMAGVPGGVEITTVADIPSRGTGLGSSSSFTVALLHALYALLGRHSTRQELAEQACHVEIDVCGEPIGKQDQYAAAYGGFNLYEFNQNDTVTVSPVICKPETIAGIRKQMLVLYTGITRGASTILKHQSAELATNTDKKSAMKRMVALCYQLLKEIRNDNLDSFGQVLHEAWMLKRDMAPGVSTSDIDDWYDTARKHGAIGGKISAPAPVVSSPFSLPRTGTRRYATRCRSCAPFRSISSELEARLFSTSQRRALSRSTDREPLNPALPTSSGASVPQKFMGPASRLRLIKTAVFAKR